WHAEPISPAGSLLHRYTGPGSLFLTVSECAAHIRTGGRWRGFLSIEPLRRVHLAAFRQVACALGSDCMGLYADSCDIDDRFGSGRPQWECVKLRTRGGGPPQRTVFEIEPKVAAAAEQTVPNVWFLEKQ